MQGRPTRNIKPRVFEDAIDSEEEEQANSEDERPRKKPARASKGKPVKDKKVGPSGGGGPSDAGPSEAGPSGERPSSRQRQNGSRQSGPEEPSERNNVAVDREELGAIEDLTKFYASELASARDTGRQLVTDAEEEKLTREMMRFMLFRQHEKPGVPVPRSNLSAMVTAAYRHKNGSGLSSFIIKCCQAKFPELMGLEMKEFNAVKPTAASDTLAKVYVLRSMLPSALRVTFVDTPYETQLNAFAMVVMALVTVNGEKMDDDDLWRHLEDLGVLNNQKKPHPVFGIVSEKLKEMENRKYLVRKVVPGPEGSKLLYELGTNAVDEITTKTIEDFLTEKLNAPLPRRGNGGIADADDEENSNEDSDVVLL